MTALEIIEPGPIALVEDRGRPGLAALGVGRSGALDRGALRLANRLVGNAEGEAGLEITYGPFEARFTSATWFAVTGAWGDVTVGDVALRDEKLRDVALRDGQRTRPVEPYDALHASAGATIRIGPASRGMRFVLGVRGGIHTPHVLGSRSVDLLAGVGGAPLRRGDMLPIGPGPDAPVPASDTMTIAQPPLDSVTVRAFVGPRADWFTVDALDTFYETEWRVSPSSNRIGMALDSADGAALTRVHNRELPSEAMLPGAVQVSHSATPTVLLADHPVTGGYPVIAVVADADLDALAQLRPGQSLRFRHPLK